MNYSEAMTYLEGTDRFGSRLGLERMGRLLELLGSPERKMPVIHVAGTNGKGSVCAYSAYILASAGYRVGFFCSPYVYDFGERIRILDGRDPARTWAEDPLDGQISRQAVAQTLTRIRAVVEAHGLIGDSHPTHFEMLTLMAFLHFSAEQCDVIVLETGLGGRLDSTNIIPSPDVAVITAIGFDHEARLGTTLVEIAGEKAGILKAGTKTLCLYDQALAIRDPGEAQAVRDVFLNRARELGIAVNELRHQAIEVLSRDLSGQRFRFQDATYFTELLPSFEPDNAALAILAVKAFLPSIDQAAITEGIRDCYWPARLELLQMDPVTLIDGGHNPQGARALRASLDQLFEEKTPEVHVCSIMKDKQIPDMFRAVLSGGRVKTLICTMPSGIHRAEPATLLAEEARAVASELGVETDIRVLEDVTEATRFALQEAKATGAVLIGWGTFYQAGAFRDAVKKGNT